MSLMAYHGRFENGQVILPKNLKIPKNGEFTITFIKDPREKRDNEIVKAQHEAFEKFIKNIEDLDAAGIEPLGEEFDKIMSKRLRFRTPEELDL